METCKSGTQCWEKQIQYQRKIIAASLLELIFFFLCLSFIWWFFFYFYRGNLPPSWTPSFGVYIWEFFLLHRTSKKSKFWKALPKDIFGISNIQRHPPILLSFAGWNFFSLKRQQHFRRFSKNGTICSFKRKGSMMTFQ